MSLLEVRDLRKTFVRGHGRRRRVVNAVDGVSFEVGAGETLGLVGESGCGKSTTAGMVVRLIEPTSGQISFAGTELAGRSERSLRPLRRELQMVFQDPQSSLNPRQTVGTILSAPFQIQGVQPDGGVLPEVRRLLERVGLNPEHYNRYPHQFSGGQRQRIGIARAIALRPKLVVCDEPVSALDVSVQAQVLNLLAGLQQEYGMAYLFVAHDLAVVRHLSDRVVVMYLGRVVEQAEREELYRSPAHPYTQALMAAVPRPRVPEQRKKVLLRGDAAADGPAGGCPFRPRCPRYATELGAADQSRCTQEAPELVPLSPRQSAACHFV
ncbi:ABC transporter ATP-binding protein [Kribbella kalugense]|uniref:Oligopeptide/dipeptide ABC transporter ATP-binding protein n=1 Tax=Kribbella kalugense TaxID=2512221 RepID=A0A4R8A313_9ACTN|nr:oligopeptide/dipeptide ABC transporter ATP-binding protein [Kribbella kalugense]TDW24635.1 oligopeptide/dipeptide ABC transporter ATP-binding protein [Kribbella kalugense]